MDKLKILEHIEKTASATPKYLEPISGGLTKEIKCKTEVCGQEFMVKLIQGNPTRDLWYKELSKHSNDQMANPKMHKLFPDGTLCLLSPWITGKSLQDRLQLATDKQIDDYAAQAAKILLQLHKTHIDYPNYQESLHNRIQGLCAKVESYGLTFPGKETICDYLMNAATNHSVDHICFVHKDVRPENFIVQNEKLHLIDFENGSLGERASDFPYLTTILWPEHHTFANKLINAYLREVDAEHFWQTNLLYSTIQVVDYAIWKWEAKQKQVFIQANNLMKQYDGLTKNIPAWFCELEGK